MSVCTRVCVCARACAQFLSHRICSVFNGYAHLHKAEPTSIHPKEAGLQLTGEDLMGICTSEVHR